MFGYRLKLFFASELSMTEGQHMQFDWIEYQDYL